MSNQKVKKEAKKRWATLAHLTAGFLSPYLVDSTEIDGSDHIHIPDQHGHRTSADDALYTTGDVEINLDLQKNAPRMNVHYSKHDGEEKHFHDVDLSLLPAALVPDPFPARVSPLQKIQRLVGLSGKIVQRIYDRISDTIKKKSSKKISILDVVRFMLHFTSSSFDLGQFLVSHYIKYRM